MWYTKDIGGLLPVGKRPQHVIDISKLIHKLNLYFLIVDISFPYEKYDAETVQIF